MTVEEQRPAGGGEWQVSQFVQDHGVGLHQLFGEGSGLALLLLALQLVHQIDGVVEAHAVCPDEWRPRLRLWTRWVFPVPVPPSQDQVMRRVHECGTCNCSICA